MKLKEILNLSDSYDVLDDTNARGCTWTSGGCFILAKSLNILYGFPIYVIIDSKNKIPHHFVVLTDRGKYLDYDGEVYGILRAFRSREFLNKNRLKLIKYDCSMNDWIKLNNIPIDYSASEKLAKIINRNTTKS